MIFSLNVLIITRQRLPSQHICAQSWGTGRSSGQWKWHVQNGYQYKFQFNGYQSRFLMLKLQDLLNHNFVKIECDDENPSLPLFASITDFSEMRRTLVRRDSGKYWYCWDVILISISPQSMTTGGKEDSCQKGQWDSVWYRYLWYILQCKR